MLDGALVLPRRKIISNQRRTFFEPSSRCPCHKTLAGFATSTETIVVTAMTERVSSLLDSCSVTDVVDRCHHMCAQLITPQP